MKRWYRLLFTATFVLIGCDRTERNLNPTETQTATAPEETVETPPKQAEAASEEGDDIFDFEDDDDDLF